MEFDQEELEIAIAEAIGTSERTRQRVVLMGDAHLRLEMRDTGRLETAHTASIMVTGPELNVAAALSALDVEAAWVSVVSDSPLGKRVLRIARGAGIDCSYVTTRPGRTAADWVGSSDHPHEPTVLEDAASTALAGIQAGRFDWESILDGATGFLISGRTLGISPSVRAEAIEGMSIANRKGIIVGFDLDYRTEDWGETEARRSFAGVVRHTDVLFVRKEPLARFFGIDGALEDVLRACVTRLGVAAATAAKERTKTSGRAAIEGLAIGKSGVLTESEPIRFTVLDRDGADDAYIAGFLAAYLEQPSGLARAVTMAAAARALVQTHRGSFLLATRDEVDALSAKSP